MYRITEVRNPGHEPKVVASYKIGERSVALDDWVNWLTIADHCHSLVRLEKRDTQGDWSATITYDQLTKTPCGD